MNQTFSNTQTSSPFQYQPSSSMMPSNVDPGLVDQQTTKFLLKNKLYTFSAAIIALLSVVLLFGIKYADDLDIEDWAEDPIVSVLAYGGLIAAFFLWRQAEKHMEELKGMVHMLRNYYAHREGQISRGEIEFIKKAA